MGLVVEDKPTEFSCTYSQIVTLKSAFRLVIKLNLHISYHTIQHTGISDPTTGMLRTALICVTCLSIIISAMTFVIGFVCGHYFSHRLKTSATSDQNKVNTSNTTNEHVQDLELNENVAYITLRPK